MKKASKRRILFAARMATMVGAACFAVSGISETFGQEKEKSRPVYIATEEVAETTYTPEVEEATQPTETAKAVETEEPLIASMDWDKDDSYLLSVMLLENIQRSDLTVYEQAQGFQMMLDLGETEDTIAEKTGFSKKTVRHRLNIAKLDSKTLMEKERQDGYQLSLTDLYELEKIKDVKIRDKILKDSTDSRDLARRAINAQKEQKRQENMKLYVAMMKKLGLKKAPKEADSEFYTDKWERMKDYSLDKEPPKTMKFEDNGEPMFYLERYGTLYVIRKKKKEKKALTPAQEAERQNKRNKKQIKAILKEAANTRKAFIEGILSGRIKKVTNEEKVVAELFEQMMSWETFTGHNTLKEFFLGDKCYNAQKEDVEAAEKKMEGLSVLHKLLCMISAMVADADLVDWNYTYSTGKGEKTKAFYKVLELYGFQYPNDEEKGVVEGTSDLYVKKEGAK